MSKRFSPRGFLIRVGLRELRSRKDDIQLVFEHCLSVTTLPDCSHVVKRAERQDALLVFVLGRRREVRSYGKRRKQCRGECGRHLFVALATIHLTSLHVISEVNFTAGSETSPLRETRWSCCTALCRNCNSLLALENDNGRPFVQSTCPRNPIDADFVCWPMCRPHSLRSAREGALRARRW
jgi:hypothetical protein